MRPCEILLRKLDLDVDDLARQRSVDEDDPSIGVTGHGVAARDETIGSQLHSPSVRARPFDRSGRHATLDA